MGEGSPRLTTVGWLTPSRLELSELYVVNTPHTTKARQSVTYVLKTALVYAIFVAFRQIPHSQL